MKKSNIVKIIILVIVIIAIATIGYVVNKNKDVVEKFSLCNIKNYQGEEIKDYKNNKLAFIIDEFDAETTVKVNGKKYESDFGFYNPGSYNIEVKKGNKTEKSKIVINPIDKNKSQNYNIYMAAETLPTLFSSFDMIKQKDEKSYIWFEREGTLDVTYLKEAFPKATISEYIGKDEASTFLQKIRNEVKEFVNNTLKDDENAHFTVYVTAEYYWLEIATLEELGLTEDRVDVVMYSCGTVDYVVNYSFLEENTIDIFNKKVKKFEKAIDETRANKHKEDNLMDYLKEEGKPYCDRDYVIVNALRKNVDYYLQFPELIEFKDKKVNKKIQKANIHKIDAKQQYKELTEEQKNEFFKLVNLDKQTFDKEYFTDKDGKYLIITGTTPVNGRYLKGMYQRMLKKVVDTYKDEYTILYKPHPRAIPEGKDEAYLKELGIKILPGKMPMEAILFVYDNIKLGGFASSLYMSANKGDTLFFFAQNKDELVEPLNVLYDDLFKDAKFINF